MRAKAETGMGTGMGTGPRLKMGKGTRMEREGGGEEL